MGLFDFLKKDNTPTPEKLLKAAKHGKLELVNILIKSGIDTNSKDKKGRTPLILASINNDTAIIKTLIDAGADINAKDNDGRTALMTVSENNDGRTPVIFASDNSNSNLETLKTLIDAGADINAKDNSGRTALTLAFDNGWLETVKTLIEAGAQIDDENKDQVLTLINGHPLPLPLPSPEAKKPFPEFAQKNDISIIVQTDKISMEISAKKCTINWGDRNTKEYNNITEKNITHRYSRASKYTITINTEELSTLNINGTITDIYLNNCPQLENLFCIYNDKLTSLDISKCTALKSLFCSGNKLTSLDLSNNLELEYLHCNDNKLISLDLSNNLKLESLNCNNNQLTRLDINKNTQLRNIDCVSNQISILNIDYNSALTQLQCNNNQLSKHELNRIFNFLPNYNSSYGTVNTWYAGTTYTPNIFCACGHNPGFDDSNKQIARKKNWLIWRKAMYISATIAGTPGHWQEDWRS